MTRRCGSGCGACSARSTSVSSSSRWCCCAAGPRPPWVPVVLLVHVAIAPFNHFVPPHLQGVQTIVLGVGLMGVAVRATETWAGSRPIARL